MSTPTSLHDRRPRQTRLIWKLLAFAGLCAGGLSASWVVALAAADFVGNRIGEAVFQSEAVLVLFGASRFCLAIFERRPMRVIGLGLYRSGAGRFLLGAAAGVMLVSACMACFRLLGMARFAEETGGTTDWAGLGAIAWACLCVSAFEELGFRGYAFQVTGRWNFSFAVAAYGIFFVATHLSAPGAIAILPIVNLLLAHALFVALLLKTRNLWLPMGLHVGWNFALAGVFGVAVSGYDLGPSLLRAELDQNIWTGNDFGPEGGIIVTTVLCLVIVAACRFVKPRTGAHQLLCSTRARDATDE